MLVNIISEEQKPASFLTLVLIFIAKSKNWQKTSLALLYLLTFDLQPPGSFFSIHAYLRFRPG